MCTGCVSLDMDAVSRDGDSTLNKAFNSVNISSDLTSDSSCSLHCVTIKRQLVADDADGGRCCLVESLLSPTEHVDSSASCQFHDLECSYLTNDRTFLDDWKTAPQTDENSVNIGPAVPVSVKSLSTAELRARLTELGESPGPIVESTRPVYERRLSRLMASSDIQLTAAGDAGHHLNAG